MSRPAAKLFLASIASILSLSSNATSLNREYIDLGIDRLTGLKNTEVYNDYVESSEDSCFPELNLHLISNFADSDAAASNLTEADFNDAIDRVGNLYKRAFQAKNIAFEVQKDWQNPQANAMATARMAQNPETGQTTVVRMVLFTGGLARIEHMTKDGMSLVACHEIGHHIGGFPTKTGRAVSNEGQSDYFSTLKCFRSVFGGEDNKKYLNDPNIEPAVISKCKEIYENEQDAGTCARAGAGALVLGKVLAHLRAKNSGGEPQQVSVTTPSEERASQTNHGHPSAQCRVDTVFAGALCKADPYSPISFRDPAKGSCIAETHAVGARPMCWYASGASFAEENSSFLRLTRR